MTDEHKSLSPNGICLSRETTYLPARHCHCTRPPRWPGTGSGLICVSNSCPSLASGRPWPLRQRHTLLLGSAVTTPITLVQVTQMKQALCSRGPTSTIYTNSPSTGQFSLTRKCAYFQTSRALLCILQRSKTSSSQTINRSLCFGRLCRVVPDIKLRIFKFMA